MPEPDVLISAPKGTSSTVRLHVHPDSHLVLAALPEIVASHPLVETGENQINIRYIGQFSNDMAGSDFKIENTKRSLIACLFKLISLDNYIVVAAGDTTDDQGLLQSERGEGNYRVFLGIAVANAKENLKGVLRGTSNIHLSRYPCLFGVVDGLLLALNKLIQEEREVEN
ncbi:MAG: hypothetical protein ACR2PT_10705 [Endozoicomonas sp.]